MGVAPVAMEKAISARELRTSLPRLVVRLRRGERFLVLYRSRPAFRLVPIDATESASTALEDDPLHEAPALGRSTDGLSSRDHDRVLYGTRRR